MRSPESGGSHRGDIARDDVLYDAALRNLQTLSEAIQRLPTRLNANYPDIPWMQISWFRNILVHHYLGSIDPLTVAAVVREHLEPLEMEPLEICVLARLSSNIEN